jgi:hypothetical protein
VRSTIPGRAVRTCRSRQTADERELGQLPVRSVRGAFPRRSASLWGRTPSRVRFRWWHAARTQTTSGSAGRARSRWRRQAGPVTRWVVDLPVRDGAVRCDVRGLRPAQAVCCHARCAQATRASPSAGIGANRYVRANPLYSSLARILIVMTDAREAALGLVITCTAGMTAVGIGLALGWSDGALGVACIGATLIAIFGYQTWLERTGRQPARPPRIDQERR